MMNLIEIKKYYPHLQGFERSLLREYLQYKILDIIYKSQYGRKLSFLGGTAIRICYDGLRFSENLDFDNLDLSKNDFEKMTKEIKKELSYLNYEVEIRNAYKGAYHSYIKFSNILYNNSLSNYQGEKIMIQVDSVKKSFNYKSKNYLLSKFDVFREINITPIDIILSQKIGAVFGRKRLKGRDFHDIIYLMNKTNFNFNFLKDKLNIKNKRELKKELFSKLKNSDFKKIARDVQPFLINQDDILRVTNFKEFIDQEIKN